MQKVKVTKEVAKALDYIIPKYGADYVVKHHASTPNYWGLEALKFQPIDLIAKAAYLGYEVEKTPEDKVREFYEDRRASSEGSAYWEQANAIEQTLNLLGIKISGVNT